MISIGLDLSINSTGVCVYDDETKNTVYYIIGSKFTKKALNNEQNIVSLCSYEKSSIEKKEYYEKEEIKTYNIYNIVSKISPIIKRYSPDVVTIEGVSFQSNGSIVDLAGLNYMVRMMLIESDVTDINIVSPTQNKKFATGNGQAEKDVMISAWHKSDTKTINIPECIKIDDIADAYFLARYGLSLYKHKKSVIL